MSGGRSIDKERKSPRESGEDSEDESEILEESPCGRWLKRREEVSQFSIVSKRWYFMEIRKTICQIRQRFASADVQVYLKLITKRSIRLDT